MKKNDRFQFVIYRENYLSDIECDKLIQALDTEKLKEGELVGDYEDSIINKNVERKHSTLIFMMRIFSLKEVITSKWLANNILIGIDSIDTLDLKYGVGGTYN